ncbi:HPr(Ser) kinase/phosphatase [soil metagenome]
MTDPSFSMEELFHTRGEALLLEHLNPEVSLSRRCSDPDISTPGLALAGFLARFPAGRMQVLGETEMTYLAALGEEERSSRLGGLFSQDLPAAFVTKGQEVPPPLLSEATQRGVPIFRTALTTKEFFRRVKPYLEVALAPSTPVHASLADVYGVGLLFVGPSGIGKSECVLDLVERGHRLVADDLVMVSQRGNDVLIGRGHELQGHHMEIRGIGIIDIQALFGIRAIRQQKRIEVVVRLDTWVDGKVYDRTGLDRDTTEILGVRLPRVTVPLNPGKNLTVISEVVAMNHLLRYAGVDSAADFDKRIRGALLPAREYLEEDHE